MPLIFVGDVVVVKDPEKSENLLVRRLAAVEGYEMVSKDEKDEPFVLEKDHYWVLADNDTLKPKKKAEQVTKPFLNALGDDYSVCCQGTAFFPLQSCMNHSCLPNAKAFKREQDRDGQATIIALRSIQKGEEIMEQSAAKERQS